MMMAVVATALFVVTACDKKDDEDNGGTENNNTIVELTAPPYKDVAKVFNLTESNGTAIKQLRMMESGAYMITLTSANLAGVRATRAGEGDLFYEFGKFTYSDGKYVFDNGMTISYTQNGDNYDITIT